MRHQFLSGAALAALVGWSLPAAAQAQSNADEIIVTAQKREQGLAEVPISITVLSGEQLERSGVTRLEDIYTVTPSVSFSPAQSSSGAGLRVRGVGSAGFGSSVESSVSTLVDGVVTGSGGAALVDMFDLERVEVLRGPQGTLFGKNSSAGAVNIVSRRPTDEFSGYGVVRYGDTLEELRVEGAISGSITENWRARLSGYSLTQGQGQVWNPVRGEDENKRDRWGVRLRSDLTLGATTLDLIVQYEEQDNACCRTSFYGLDPVAYGALTNLYLLPRLAANGVTPGPDNRISIADGPLNESTETLHTVLTAEHTFGSGFVLRAIGGYRTWDELDTIDVDGVDVNIGNDPRQQRSLELFTGEIQLISPNEGRLQYVLGAYLYDQNLKTDTITAGGAGTIFGQLSTRGLGSVRVNNYAVFADGTYDFTDQWQAFAGVRVLYEEMHVTSYRSGNYFAFPPPGTFYGEAKADDTNWVGRMGLRYTPSDNLSFYVSASRGYKGRAIEGGNTMFSADPAVRATAILDPETVNAFELGARTNWWDGRLMLNATAFYSAFYDYQASSFDNVANNQIFRNAAELRSQGIELDFIARPWEGMTLAGGLAYIDAIYESYPNAPCTSVQVATPSDPNCIDRNPDPAINARTQDLAGQQLANSPKWQTYIRAQQDFRLGADMGLYLRGEYAWRDSAIYGGDLNPATEQKAFGLANFRTGLTLADGRYEIAAFVENAFDESYALRIYDSPAFTGSYSAFFGPSRTYGMELRARF
ncbi:MAG: TonB-dependent receptor [Terricaulis sp.]|nr:TonB-dependent receptor [Terricaulis sp.]